VTAVAARKRDKDQGRRSDIEQELTERYHVEFTYLPGVSTSEFDIDKSLKNQARFDAIDEATVELYKEAALRGDAFPAVLAYRPGRSANAKLVSIDGNHRLVSHDQAGVPLDVYEIARGTKPQTIALMTFSFNTKHGRPTSEAERVSQALYLIDNGAGQEAAAAAVNVPVRIVKKAVLKAGADKRADEVGVDRREWEALPQTSRSRLLNIGTDEGFHDAVHLAYAARLDSNEIFELTTLLNTSKSATKQRAILKAETARYADRIQDVAGGALGNAGRKPMTPKGRLMMILGQVTALPDDTRAVASSFSAQEKTDAASRLMTASEHLRKVALALDPKIT
jgi:hypothetical protein